MPSLRWLVVHLGLASLLVQLHAVHVNHRPLDGKRIERHVAILSGQGESPWGYRVATPWLVEQARRVLQEPLPEPLPPPRSAARWRVGRPVELGYLAARFAATLVSLVAMHSWLAGWLRRDEAAAGTLWFAALHAVSYVNYWYQPASATDLALWCVALCLLQRGRDAWLAPLVLFGALNRETSLFIVLFYVAMRSDALRWHQLASRATALFGLWLVPQLGLRWAFGALPPAGGMTVADHLRENVTNPSWLVFAASYFGVLWAAPLLAGRAAPAPLRRLALALVPYLVLVLLYGRVREVRLFLPLAPVWLALALVWLREPTPRGEISGADR